MCKLALVIGAVIVFVTANRVAGQGTATCRSADSQSTYYAAVLVDITTSTDAESVLLRQSLQLPELAPRAVGLTTNRRLCSKAAAALDAEQGIIAGRQLYVFKLGPKNYAVVHVQPPPSPNVFSSGDTPVWFFDRNWTFLSLSGI